MLYSLYVLDKIPIYKVTVEVLRNFEWFKTNLSTTTITAYRTLGNLDISILMHPIKRKNIEDSFEND